MTVLTKHLFLLLFLLVFATSAAHANMQDYPVVKLRSLDKVSARTMTFEANVGSTMKFGDLYIKVQACRKAPPIEQPESAAFLQIWEVTPDRESQWVYSGWMFASSPGLASMDHPIYDVWVLDCLGAVEEETAIEEQPLESPLEEDSMGEVSVDEGSEAVGDGILEDSQVPSQPGGAPPVSGEREAQ